MNVVNTWCHASMCYEPPINIKCHLYRIGRFTQSIVYTLNDNYFTKFICLVLT